MFLNQQSSYLGKTGVLERIPSLGTTYFLKKNKTNTHTHPHCPSNNVTFLKYYFKLVGCIFIRRLCHVIIMFP